jgi:hypothetical protein
MTTTRPETFEPEVLALLGAIFDEIWNTVGAESQYADPAAKASARARLADIMLQLAGQQLAEGHLKQKAIAVFRNVPESRSEAGAQTAHELLLT